MKKFLSMFLIFGLIAVSGSCSAAAAATIFISESDFIAALDAYYLEEFDDLEMDGGGSSLTRGPENGFSYTITSSASFGGSLYHMDQSLSTSERADSLEFTFTGDNVTAFGGFFWPTTLECDDAAAGMTIEIIYAGGSTETFAVENTAYRMFTGFISDEAMTSIVFSENGDSVWTDGDGLFVSADHIYAGTSAVPVPGAVWLFGSGLLGLAGLYRKAHK